MNRKPGDWNCRSCQYLNFSRRDVCQRCGDPRSNSSDRSDYANFGGGRGGSSFGFGGSDVRPGDWYCSCGPTTSPADRTASSAMPSRKTLRSAAAAAAEPSRPTCRAHEDSALAPAAAVAAAAAAAGVLGGSPATGFAPGRDATSTTSRAGWSASGAMHLGNPGLKSEKAESKRIVRLLMREMRLRDIMTCYETNLKLLLVLPLFCFCFSVIFTW
uniref:RanBP2-type domain-containing protein n=1 Tax=Ananas comosus var. bracteatus TaxID=296719 RepID=A0A6V7QJK9_ANACO|nr:unnamed protein product [Ananas comosus var. bracteatus]